MGERLGQLGLPDRVQGRLGAAHERRGISRHWSGHRIGATSASEYLARRDDICRIQTLDLRVEVPSTPDRYSKATGFTKYIVLVIGFAVVVKGVNDLPAAVKTLLRKYATQRNKPAT